jgi:hypothetical protein
MDEFERELRTAMSRQPAPPFLKRKLLARREKEHASRRHERVVWWQRLAATAVLCGIAGGVAIWHNAEQQRKGEEAKQQVFTALRIANRALQQMNAQLKQRDNNAE